MVKGSKKATRKFAQSGQLKKTIQARRKHQQIQKKITKKQTGKKSGANAREEDGEEDQDEVEEKGSKSKSLKGMSVDDFLGGGFIDEDDEDVVSDAEGLDEDEEGEDEDEEGLDDDHSFASVDDLEDEGVNHLEELSKLAEKDPEFYKYLQENDRELLDFDPNAIEEDSEEEAEEDDAMETDKIPVLTKQVLQKWQKALLEQRSLRALRKLLIAFRSAAHMNEEDQVVAWTVDSPSVYNKLVITALRYTPVVLEHHCPYKTLANGKFKAPAQTHKLKTLQKMILSYFHNVIHITSQMSDPDMLKLAVSESAKLLPYVVSSRRAVKQYLKACLELWSTADDTVRIAAFLAIRKLASATDESIMDMVLKGTYLALVRSCKSTSAHTLPSILLMKNSASEIFCMDHAAAYQHAFGYIRQLAIHLRNSMKMKTKVGFIYLFVSTDLAHPPSQESFKQVYNWQFVHSIDFWSLVLARACDAQATAEKGGEDSALKPLVYPLVQVATGAIKLISNARSFPFHFHLLRSLIHLSRHTRTYIPLAPHLLPILTTLLATSKPKASTLRPLDFDTTIRVPQQYLGTRIYTEGADALEGVWAGEGGWEEVPWGG
ncbi:hypothetical protein EWM64_g7117 [Hericium alpestre]|uniref:Nucleolar complex protein 2 n=1 Tax=Hericium alpestre TaxID=135208 RepID=A0A4Y9ZPR8_9AGAM|nr:hypothetical protein EWM64_g7117 [Hericium alpestre]